MSSRPPKDAPLESGESLQYAHGEPQDRAVPLVRGRGHDGEPQDRAVPLARGGGHEGDMGRSLEDGSPENDFSESAFPDESSLEGPFDGSLDRSFACPPEGGFSEDGFSGQDTVEQAGKIAVCTLLSRVLGLIRDVLIIAALGVGADIFFMAFRLPNIMRRMTAEGVLGMAHSVSLGQKFPALAAAGQVRHGQVRREQGAVEAPLAQNDENGTCPESMYPPGIDASGYGSVIRYSLRAAWKYGLITALVAAVLAIFAPLCMRLVAPGFEAVRLEETVYLFRWCLLYLPLAAGTAILAATLISCQRAGHAALAPLFLNMGIIALGLGAFATGSAVFFAVGVVFGGLLQMPWLAHVLYRLYLFDKLQQGPPPLPHKESGETRGGTPLSRLFGAMQQAGCHMRDFCGHSMHSVCLRVRSCVRERESLGQTGKEGAGRVRKVFCSPRQGWEILRSRLHSAGRVGITVMVGSSGYLYFFMSSVGASFFSEGAVSAMYIGERLIEFPLALIGASFAMAFMPQFSLLARDKEALRHAFEKNLRLCCFIIFPATAGIVTLHEPIVRMLFGHGAMETEGIILAARIFAIMGCALPALCLSRQYMGVLVALDGGGRLVGEKGTIMRHMAHTVWAGCVIIVGVSALLGPVLGLVAVALGVLVASWGQCLYLWKLTRRELGMPGLLRFMGQERCVIGGVVILLVLLSFIAHWLNGLHSGWLEAVVVCCVVAGTVIGWIGGFVLLGNGEAKTLWGMIRSCYP